MRRKGTLLDRLSVPKGHVSQTWLFYLRLVARWRGLTWEYFRELDTDDQAAYVAEYEITTKLDILDALDRLRKDRRRAKRGK